MLLRRRVDRWGRSLASIGAGLPTGPSGGIGRYRPGEEPKGDVVRRRGHEPAESGEVDSAFRQQRLTSELDSLFNGLARGDLAVEGIVELSALRRMDRAGSHEGVDSEFLGGSEHRRSHRLAALPPQVVRLVERGGVEFEDDQFRVQ